MCAQNIYTRIDKLQLKSSAVARFNAAAAAAAPKKKFIGERDVNWLARCASLVRVCHGDTAETDLFVVAFFVVFSLHQLLSNA